MKLACVLVAAAVLLHQSLAADADVQQVMRMLRQPRQLERWQQNPDPTLNAFSWSNCGASSDPVQIKNLTLTPDPVKLPGNITVSFGAELGVGLTAPVELNLKIKKKIGIWIEIPCLEGVGSCDYSDMCQLLHDNVTCPPDFAKHNVPCDCPVKQGSYYLPGSTFYVKLPSTIPSWLDDGDYEVQATLKAAGKELGCFKVNLSITK